jgi:hypothetical protein
MANPFESRINSVKPRPMRAVFNFAGVAAVVDEPLVETPVVAPAEFVAVDFGRRRLGLVVAEGLLLLAAALGRVVRNAPRTSSSCWANACIWPKPASTIRKVKKIVLLFIAKTSP